MTLKEKVIKRLKDGFGIELPMDVEWKTRQAHGNAIGMGVHSWYFCDIRIPWQDCFGCCSSVKEALSWKRWVINTDVHELEISEYKEIERNWYDTHSFLIEKLEGEH